MGSLTEWRRLIEHMEWADALVWSELARFPPAAEDPRLRTLVHHIHTVQYIYLQLWRGEPVDVADEASVDHLSPIFDRARSYYADVPVFLASLDDRKLDRAVRIPWAGELAARYGEVRPTVLRDSLVQVTMHSAYHRGQVNARIRALGGEPPLTDFIVWIWRGRPRAEWPAEAEAFGS